MDIYGKIRKLEGAINFVPFRYQGQYEDIESGLYYNRFRYYDCISGNYISQDPIGLMGNNPTFYGYVSDCNTEVDIFGLATQMVGGIRMGDWGEKVAAKYLNNQGHTILGSVQNASGHGFDLVTKTRDGSINIIEVKTSHNIPAGKSNMSTWTNNNINKISGNTNGRWSSKPNYQNDLMRTIRDAQSKGKLKNKLVQINVNKRSITITCK